MDHRVHISLKHKVNTDLGFYSLCMCTLEEGPQGKVGSQRFEGWRMH